MNLYINVFVLYRLSTCVYLFGFAFFSLFSFSFSSHFSFFFFAYDSMEERLEIYTDNVTKSIQMCYRRKGGMGSC